jgi:hypothetical protein
MSPERWQQITEIFYHALQYQMERRLAYLDECCADDLALREEVESLLESSRLAEAAGFLELN